MASERQYPLQESSLLSDDSWDSLESQLNGVEQEALFDAPAPSGYATGSFPEISLEAISGSAVSLEKNTERKSPLSDSISSDPYWDSLESQIDSIESNALFGTLVPNPTATGSFPEISLSTISGSAVSIGRNTERKSPLADSMNSDPNWDSLESQIDSIETNALLLESTPGSASGSFAEITLDEISGSATGKATATGSFSEISLSSPDGLATGKASATGAFSEINLSSPEGVASGKASATGAFSEITLEEIQGLATGKASATGSFPEITLSGPDGLATGKASTSGSFSEITLEAIQGSASVTSPGNATGSFSEITTTPATGYATGRATCSGSFPEITVIPPNADITLTIFDVLGCEPGMIPGRFFDRRVKKAKYEFME